MTHDVAQCTDGVVEVSARLDAEALRHRDLDVRDVVAVPDRLEQRVGEAQVEDLLQSELPEEVIDAADLTLVEVLPKVGVERPRRGEIVPERLLDHHPRALEQLRLGEPARDGREQRRRYLEVVDAPLRAPQLRREAAERLRIGEVALHVGEALGEAREDLGIDGLVRADRRTCPVAQLVDRDVIDGDAHDRAVEQAARLEPVEREEGHLTGQVARDAERHEDVGGVLCAWSHGVSVRNLYAPSVFLAARDLDPIAGTH